MVKNIFSLLKGNIKKRAVYLSFSVFFIVLLIVAFLIFKSEQSRARHERERALYVLKATAQKIKFTIERGLSNTYTLEALIRQGNGHISNFEEVTARMLALHPALFTVAVSPDGIVEKIAPLAGNEKVLGRNQFSDPLHSKETILSLQGLALAGPIVLIQGQFAAIGRLPVFLDDNGTARFWGLVSVTLKFPDVLAVAEVDNLQSLGYAYDLWRVNPKNGEKQTIAVSGQESLQNPLQQNIELPQATWTLSIAPINGGSDPAGLLLKIVIGLLISILFGFLTWLLLDSIRHKQQLEHLAFADAVTGLPNRRLLLDRLSRSVAHIERYGGCLAVAFIDLDGFKGINDNHGHEVGDHILREVAIRTKEALREADTIARIGGDEFVVVMQGLDDHGSNLMVNRLLSSISSPIHVDHLTLRISASIGLAFYRQGEKLNAHDLLRRADLAMYQAKVAGKSRYEVYDASMSIPY